MNKLFKNIIAFFVVTALAVTLLLPVAVLAAPRTELVELVDFSGYTVNQYLAGQPAGAERQWTPVNTAEGTATYIRPAVPPYNNVSNGRVADFVNDANGQIKYDFPMQSVECTITARVFVTQGAFFAFWFLGTQGILGHLNMNNGAFSYNSNGTNRNFIDPQHVIPAGGEWMQFAIRGYSSRDNGNFDAVEVFVGWSGGPMTKLTPEAPLEPTYRTITTNINAIAVQVASGHFYFDYFKLERTNILERLDTPETPRWNGNTLSWNTIANAEGYKVRLFKDGNEVAMLPRTGDPAITQPEIDLTSAMLDFGYGSYIARVTAVAVPGEDKDSLESGASSPNDFINANPPLPTPEKPFWAGETINWNPIANADSYLLDLYRGAVRLKTLTATGNATSLNLSTDLRRLGKGNYKVQLRAIADVKINNNSQISAFSEELSYDPDKSTETPTDEYYCVLSADELVPETMAGQSNLSVTTDFTLPLSGQNGVSISWSSDHPENARVASDGSVSITRPRIGRDVLVTLTGSFTKGNASYMKMYKFLIKSLEPSNVSNQSERSPQDIIFGSYSDGSADIFNDVTGEHWAKYFIEYLWLEGIVSGTGEGYFEPERSVKREEACKMLVNILGLTDIKDDAGFRDVKAGDWFYSPVQTAYNAELVKGIGNELFGAGSDITRQDLAVMIVRTAQYAGVDLALLSVDENGEPREAGPFSDENDIDAYAKESVSLLKMAGFVTPNENGGFEPLRTATRAETAKMMCLIYLIIK